MGKTLWFLGQNSDQTYKGGLEWRAGGQAAHTALVTKRLCTEEGLPPHLSFLNYEARI